MLGLPKGGWLCPGTLLRLRDPCLAAVCNRKGRSMLKTLEGRGAAGAYTGPEESKVLAQGHLQVCLVIWEWMLQEASGALCTKHVCNGLSWGCW